MEPLLAVHGEPTQIRADNGREFIADSLLDWHGEQEVHGACIAKASLWQKASKNASTARWGAGSLGTSSTTRS